MATDAAVSQPRHTRPSRTVVISNVPPTFNMRNFLALKGFGRPIESVIVHPDNKKVEISFLERRSAELLAAAREKNEFALDGHELELEFVKPRPIPVEVIAAIGTREASRKIILNSLPKRDGKEGWTEKELEEEMGRYGKVESVWIDPQNGQKATVVFADILQAVKASKTLRIEEAYKDSGVRFYSDVTLKTHLPESGEDGPHSVYLTGLPLDITPSRLLKDLNSVLVFERGEPLIRVNMVKNTAFLHFTYPSVAKLFYDSYHPTRGVSKSWAANDGVIHRKHIAAIRLGATRTVYITDFNDPRINFDRLRTDFSKFGRLAHVYTDWDSRRAYVEFTDITSACNAIDHIAENNRNFSIYAGSRISFGKRISHGQKHGNVSPLIIATVGSEDTSAKPKKAAVVA
ncbi:hypothetical protein K435DRAFT_774303 [Dendrothele bispora CBS 962.96]|uniref:RRM domain-containing protein n=1 Tax=Dendrothele bispora (strain CBS 962.96) TaxID=1314807 RepID=A0A4S8MP61_DENBC|nr:hypothetical protein K435DRAFT_774303 [Dendrothele bispora CBS 962.96]